MNYKKNGQYHMIPFVSHRLSGQALIMLLGVVAVAAVVTFMVFNSGRAVNEKINLVNAADAAAYSGAQITARQLNFMAYTNRAMIANEVAIGHSLSFYMEVDLIRQVTTAVNQIFPGFDSIGRITQEISSVITGIYMLAVDANNANFSNMQEAAFHNFASRDGAGISVLEGAMRSVLNEYRAPGTLPILLNNPTTLDQFDKEDDTVSAQVAQAALDARTMNEQFCNMVMFVSPTRITDSDVSTGNQMADYCSDLVAGRSASGAGSPDLPMLDQGVMLEMLRSTSNAVDDAGWVRDRNLTYSKPTLLGRLTITRTGTSEIDFDDDGQLNWASGSDGMNFRLQFNLATRALLFLFGVTTPAISTAVTADGNSVEHSRETGVTLDDFARTLLQNAELCDADHNGDGDVDIGCDDLVGQSYRGVQRYAYLNSLAQNARTTAFVTQARCSDGIGRDENGVKIEGWRDNLQYLEEDRDICADNIYAVSQAEVFFERPQCIDVACSVGFQTTSTGVERPNLFNPFWQARLR